VRFVLAIISFVVAAVMIGAGIAQRTILLEPDEVALSSTSTTGTAVTVVDGDALNAFDGSQTLTISGSDEIVAAYGRTVDVLAWIGDTEYTEIGYDAKADELTSTLVPGAEKKVPSIKGSDLWLDEYARADSLALTVKAPSDVSFIIVSDGVKPAPADVAISWPLDNSTPWAGPLIVAGAVVLLLGLAFLLWATNHMRSSRGPRRKPQKMPKVPRKALYKPSRKAAIERPASGRRSATGMIAVPIVLVGALTLAGCTADFWPGTGTAASPSPSASAVPADAQADPPAATVRQIQRIVAAISTTTAKADADKDATLLGTRFQGAALELRLANYAITTADPTLAALTAIPTGPVKVTLPQKTDTWPRTVFAVIQDDTDSTVPPLALFLEQEDARANYKVSYAITLEPAAVLPKVAPAAIGTSRLSDDSSVLRLSPDELALGYADILEKDVDSDAYLDFEADGDSLRENVGVKYKATVRASLPATAAVAFGHALGAADAIALATNDAGALIAVNLNETTTVTPVEAGAAVNPTGQVKALSGLAISTKGVIATYGDQLLFYVPPTGSDEKIVLLGYTQGLVKAGEVG
jgi:hypothetical protein